MSSLVYARLLFYYGGEKGTESVKKNYKFLIMYDGSRFYGWQRQPDQDTVQGRIENVLSKMCEEEIEVIGAGRTDAGVHAKAMVANAAFETQMDTEQIKNYLNRYLPDDIAVTEVREASPRFHSRYNATGKTYCYTCHVGDNKPVFFRKYRWYLEQVPDVEKMKEAAEILLGEHDFRNFCVNPRMKKSTVRMVDKIDIVRQEDTLTFTVHGTGFLQNMVRIIVGTLVEVGYGNLDCAHIEKALHAEERMKAGPTAPPQGLCLIKVDYE